MKILEMRPVSYNGRMDKISSGRVREVKTTLAAQVPKGSRVLEIGCGTGELASLLVEQGCVVAGFDLNPSMVKTAEKRIETDGLEGKFSVKRMGIEGMDGFPDSNFDAVVSTLVFSELNNNERRFALEHAARVLRPGGHIVIADEVVPRKAMRRFLHAAVRLPLLVATYLVTGASTRPVDDLSGQMSEVGFCVVKETRSHGDSFAIVFGFKKEKEDTS
ncbi:corrinoid protein-associated methyltransferase CpaM [Thermodesulfobacteriota bacterium]